jgi:hypothetical protein
VKYGLNRSWNPVKHIENRGSALLTPIFHTLRVPHWASFDKTDDDARIPSAPTGHCIPAQCEALGSHYSPSLRSEGTPQVSSSGYEELPPCRTCGERSERGEACRRAAGAGGRSFCRSVRGVGKVIEWHLLCKCEGPTPQGGARWVCYGLGGYKINQGIPYFYSSL